MGSVALILTGKPVSVPGFGNDISPPSSSSTHCVLDYVIKLTKDATLVTPSDHDHLRAVGFDDRAILQITLIASWFNYINRVADALGVDRP